MLASAAILVLLSYGLLQSGDATPDARRISPPGAKTRTAAGKTPARKPQPKVDYLRIQVLLDRAHFSPGQIDGEGGENTNRALRAYRAVHPKMPLEAGKQKIPTLTDYTITMDDVRGPFTQEIPKELMEQAKLPALSYQSPAEALGEKFHASPELLARLNEGKDLSQPGTVIRVPNIHDKPSFSRSRSWRRRILPLADLGTASTNSTRRTRL